MQVQEHIHQAERNLGGGNPINRERVDELEFAEELTADHREFRSEKQVFYDNKFYETHSDLQIPYTTQSIYAQREIDFVRKLPRRKNGFADFNRYQAATWLFLMISVPATGLSAYTCYITFEESEVQLLVAAFALCTLFILCLSIANMVVFMKMDPISPEVFRNHRQLREIAPRNYLLLVVWHNWRAGLPDYEKVPMLKKPQPRPIPQRLRPCYICNAFLGEYRLRHCRRCNKCVSEFDHHYKWLNQCISRKNYLNFFVFITASLLYYLSSCIWLLVAGFKVELLKKTMVLLAAAQGLQVALFTLQVVFNIYLLAKGITWSEFKASLQAEVSPSTLVNPIHRIQVNQNSANQVVVSGNSIELRRAPDEERQELVEEQKEMEDEQAQQEQTRLEQAQVLQTIRILQKLSRDIRRFAPDVDDLAKQRNVDEEQPSLPSIRNAEFDLTSLEVLVLAKAAANPVQTQPIQRQIERNIEREATSRVGSFFTNIVDRVASAADSFQVRGFQPGERIRNFIIPRSAQVYQEFRDDFSELYRGRLQLQNEGNSNEEGPGPEEGMGQPEQLRSVLVRLPQMVNFQSWAMERRNRIISILDFLL